MIHEVQPAEPDAVTDKPKRRWYQFNLASLLLSIAVLGIILAAGKWAYDEYLPVPWIQFSHSKLKELRSDSRPVIIHFIAMWGPPASDVHLFQTSEVKREIRKRGVTLLLADWTNPDKEIEQSLAEYGVISMPLTVIYPARRNAHPVLLCDPATSEQILLALRGR